MLGPQLYAAFGWDILGATFLLNFGSVLVKSSGHTALEKVRKDRKDCWWGHWTTMSKFQEEKHEGRISVTNGIVQLEGKEKKLLIHGKSLLTMAPWASPERLKSFGRQLSCVPGKLRLRVAIHRVAKDSDNSGPIKRQKQRQAERRADGTINYPN